MDKAVHKTVRVRADHRCEYCRFPEAFAELPFHFDHVIAATGFRVDLSRLTLLSPSLREDIAEYKGAPILTRHFQSSVPGLYFIGLTAAASFGPLMRFTFGARYNARRLTRALVRSRRASAESFAGSTLDGHAGTRV